MEATKGDNQFKSGTEKSTRNTHHQSGSIGAERSSTACRLVSSDQVGCPRQHAISPSHWNSSNSMQHPELAQVVENFLWYLSHQFIKPAMEARKRDNQFKSGTENQRETRTSKVAPSVQKGHPRPAVWWVHFRSAVQGNMPSVLPIRTAQIRCSTQNLPKFLKISFDNCLINS